MLWLVLLKYLFAFLLSIIGIALLVFSYKLSTGNESDYRNNKLRTHKWYYPFAGGLSTFHDGYRDDRVHAGIAVDMKKNEWREQGALSEEAIDSTTRN